MSTAPNVDALIERLDEHAKKYRKALPMKIKDIALPTSVIDWERAAGALRTLQDKLDYALMTVDREKAICEQVTEQLEQATEALRYTAFYGSSVPLGMSAEDYYHGAMNDLISHAARALEKQP